MCREIPVPYRGLGVTGPVPFDGLEHLPQVLRGRNEADVVEPRGPQSRDGWFRQWSPNPPSRATLRWTSPRRISRRAGQSGTRAILP
jgi:hypothetical protein